VVHALRLNTPPNCHDKKNARRELSVVACVTEKEEKSQHRMIKIAYSDRWSGTTAFAEVSFWVFKASWIVLFVLLLATATNSKAQDNVSTNQSTNQQDKLDQLIKAQEKSFKLQEEQLAEQKKHNQELIDIENKKLEELKKEVSIKEKNEKVEAYLKQVQELKEKQDQFENENRQKVE